MTLPDADSIETFGGAKQDAPIGVVDVQSERSAADVNKAYEDVAQMTRTANRAWARVALSGAAAALASPNGSDALWGNGSPPACDAPGGTGVYTVTWPSTVTDALGAAHTVSFKRCRAFVEGGGTFALVMAAVTAPNVVTIYTAVPNGTPTNLAGYTVLVEAD